MDAGLAAADTDIGTEATQFRHVHEAVFENRFLDRALPRGQGHQRHELRLQVGSKAGIDVSGHIDRPDGARALDGHRIETAMDLAAGFDQLVEQDSDQFRAHLGQPDLATGHGAGHGIGACLDSIADHRPVGALEAGDALDDDCGGPLAGDLGAHGVQAFGQVGDFRLAGAIGHHRRAVCQHGRHQGVFGGADGNERKRDFGAFQAARRLGEDIAFVHVDMGAQGFQRLEVQVNRTGANRAAAGQ